ncbi:MAG: hypothetical protein WAV00_01315 [Nocardioides sp.]
MRSQPAHVAAIAVAAVVALCASVCVALPARAGTSQTASSVPPWLQRMNDVRVAAGVAAATENTAWTLGIQHHMTYLERTDPSLRTGQYASDHTENRASPYYTADGALEGSRSNLVRHASQTATSAVDYWLGAPFHAIGMLRSGLAQTAFAQDSTYAGMDVISGLGSTSHSSPILFPGPGSTSYLTRYAGNESPDPIETCRSTKSGADYTAPSLPIIAMLPAAPTNNLTATLTTPSGTVLSRTGADVCVVDEVTYVSSDQVHGPTGKQILTSDHAVLIIPRTRLVTGTYAVRISQSKQADIAWSFVVDPNAAPSSSPTTTAPTTTAPTTTAPTTTAPPSTPPTSTAPTTTAPTSTATTPPPVALAPAVTTSQIICSNGARASGSAAVTVRNPADGAGGATYPVVLGTRTRTGTAVDGAAVTLAMSGLPPGLLPGRVAGSDGTSAVYSAQVPTCPRYEGVRVHLTKLAHHRLRIGLDNTRNAVATRFRLEVGSDRSPHVVAATASGRVRVRLLRVTRIRVYVDGHRVAQARVRP